MSDYSAQITALEKAAASGELTVESDGERVTYRSMSDLLKALEYFRGRQSAPASLLPARGATVAAYEPY